MTKITLVQHSILTIGETVETRTVGIFDCEGKMKVAVDEIRLTAGFRETLDSFWYITFEMNQVCKGVKEGFQIESLKEYKWRRLKW